MSRQRRRQPSRSRSNQDGYALLMAIFMVATVIVMATALTPSILTEGRREREQEVIWSGNEYVRAIQLYYKKNGRYPQTVDDLSKGTPGVHFLRKDYKDPMNASDGNWRFIYVSPSGQLIGSVRYHNLQEMALMLNMPGAGQALNLTGTNGQPGANGQPNSPGPGQPGTGQPGAPGNGAPGATPGASPPIGPTDPQGNPVAGQGGSLAGPNSQTAQAGQSGQQPDQGFGPTQNAFGSSFGQGGSGQSGFGQSGFGTPGTSAGSGFGTGGAGGLGSPAISNVPLAAVDGPVLGAFLIGVASKVKRPSLMVYQGGKTYFEWEFIFNPLSVVSVGGQATPGAVAPGTAPPGINGQVGATSPTSGFSMTPLGGGGTPGQQQLGLPPMK